MKNIKSYSVLYLNCFDDYYHLRQVSANVQKKLSVLHETIL